MKLHWSPRSPFVRKVMICIHECGLGGIEYVRTPTDINTPNMQLLPDNPIGKIPALLLDDGSYRTNPDPVPYLNEQGTRRVGSTLDGLTGVLTHAFGDYRLHPTQAVTFTEIGRAHV